MSIKTWILTGIVFAVLIGVFVYLSKAPEIPIAPKHASANMSQMNQSVLLHEWNGIVKDACRPFLGDPHADWTLIEIGDFQCTHCRDASSMAADLPNMSQKHLKLGFVNFPLKTVHANAEGAAIVLMIAEKHNKLWNMYTQLYENQDPLQKDTPAQALETFASDASSIGLDPALIKKEFNDPKFKQRIDLQVKHVQNIHVVSTPTFLLKHDNDNTVYWFVGTEGQPADPDLHLPAYPGLSSLMSSKPIWIGGKLPKPVY